MKKNNLAKLIHTATILYFISLSLFHGCMETFQPDNSNTRNIKTTVFKIYNPTTGELTPVRGAEVTIFEEKDGIQSEIKTIQTNENGVANFNLDIPLIGKLYSIKATYNLESQIKSSILICKDTILRFIFFDDLNQINCTNLNSNDTLIFYDNEGNSRLKKNTPRNINKYERCITYTVSNNNAGPIEFELPYVNPPFEITQILVADKFVTLNTNKISVNPGQALTICFSVSTTFAGIFQNYFPITVRCTDGSQGILNILLKAEVVEPSCDCQDIKEYAEIKIDRITVGETKNFDTIDVFVNNLACSVVITQTGANLDDGWTITSPTFPVTLAKGEVLRISGKFSSTHAGVATGILNLIVNPQGTTYNCKLDVLLNGEGCSPVCPFIGFTDRFTLEEFGIHSPFDDIISNRSDNKVFISTPNMSSEPNMLSIASKFYYIYNPDSSCNEAEINIEMIPADTHAQKYFSISPSKLILFPGENGQLEVSFTAPTIDELKAILQERKGNGPYTAQDSSFSIIIKLTSKNCVQIMNITATVTTFPDISPIINLRAYAQETIQKPVPENEVYYFGQSARTIIKKQDGSNGSYPPTLGNIWVDVNDNLPSANPPQEPILKLVHNNLQIKLWKSAYPESRFSDVAILVTEFTQDPSYNIGYGPGPITGINVGDVYAIKFDERYYALMYIRRVDNGTENTSSKQSGIEFRAVYPIYF